MLGATTACTFSTSEPPKVVRTCGAFYILTSKCASRHNGVHFFDISTSKSGPTMWCVLYILTLKYLGSALPFTLILDFLNSSFHFESVFAPGLDCDHSPSPGA